MKLSILVSLVYVGSVMCACMQLQAASVQYQVIADEGFEGVIVPKEVAPDFPIVDLYDYEKIDEYWTPTREDVLKAEGRLKTYLKNEAPNLAEKLTEYKRQYVGVMMEGRRKLYLNCFCRQFIDGAERRESIMHQDWKEHPILVKDGGDCFFRVWYDATSGTFSRLDINGEA